MAGLPASGKSAVGAELQKALNAVLLDKDTVRNFLFADYVDYSDSQNDLCLNVMYQVSHYLLCSQSPPVVILDGRTYSRRYQIEALKAEAERADSRLCLIECVCSEASARQRLEQDQEVHVAKDRDFQMYLNSKARAEPITEARLVLDTDAYALDACVQQALEYMSTA